VLEEWAKRQPKFEEADMENSHNDGMTDAERTAHSVKAWAAWVDGRIKDAIEAERALVWEVLGEMFASERHDTEGKIRDAKLQMIEKILDSTAAIRKSLGEVIDLPKWPKNGDGSTVN
jgi:hypothetical protein